MNPDTDICQNCHTGGLRPHLTTYAAWHVAPIENANEMSIFIVAPGVTAWTCPVCGARAFDANVMNHLMMLVGPPVQRLSDSHRPRSSRSKVERRMSNVVTRHS